MKIFNKKISEIRMPGFLTMMNPVSRTSLKITDLQTGRKLLFIDLESSFLDRVFRSTPLVWRITENKKVIAKISYLVKDEEKEDTPVKKRGFFSRFKNWFKSSDWALQSYSSEPVISAETFLLLYLVYNDVTSSSPD